MNDGRTVEFTFTMYWKSTIYYFIKLINQFKSLLDKDPKTKLIFFLNLIFIMSNAIGKLKHAEADQN